MNSDKEPLPFRTTPFLFRLLATIFAMECVFLGYAFHICSDRTPNDPDPLVTYRCPRIGQRSQEIFQQAMAVTLSLLGGGAIAGGFKPEKRPSDAPFSSPPSRPSARRSPRRPVPPGQEKEKDQE